MRVSTCREILDALPPGTSDFALFVADDPQPDAREQAALEKGQVLPSLSARFEHMSSGDLEPVLDVRVEEDTGEITIHTEQDAGAAGGMEGPIRVEALVSAARAMSSSAELFWVGGLRPIGGGYQVRFALPIVGFARSEEDGQLIIYGGRQRFWRISAKFVVSGFFDNLSSNFFTRSGVCRVGKVPRFRTSPSVCE